MGNYWLQVLYNRPIKKTMGKYTKKKNEKDGKAVANFSKVVTISTITLETRFKRRGEMESLLWRWQVAMQLLHAFLWIITKSFTYKVLKGILSTALLGYLIPQVFLGQQGKKNLYPSLKGSFYPACLTLSPYRNRNLPFNFNSFPIFLVLRLNFFSKNATMSSK